MKTLSQIVDQFISASYDQIMDQVDYDIWHGLESNVLQPVDLVLDLSKMVSNQCENR